MKGGTRLDAFDVELLEAMATHGRVGVLELARILGVARGTVQARLQRLESNGVIRSYRPAIDIVAAGFPVQAVISLEISQGALEEVAADLAKIPRVIEAFATTGAGRDVPDRRS
ncbi:Lrp/AsnC family transcriptional regulator [Nocardia sp. CA-107356]|uniref:Lrp/AsnC family transcriptional regulator n=1 Tax=Nocardia sp. CA-107356 TaxID=3239972 RepID=UPI003D90B50C